MRFIKTIVLVIVAVLSFKAADLITTNHLHASSSENSPFDVHFPSLELAAIKSVDAVVHIKSTYLKDEYYHYNHPYYGRGIYSKPKEEFASGSGVIISKDGYVVTNRHVINGATEIEVVLNDKQKFKAEILGEDNETDLALLKINGQKLPHIEFADSDVAQVGQWVLAVGNPFNLTSTVTAGIISAKGRDLGIMEGRGVESFIQTDAAINPGNSGGALVNTEGELVGINTAIQSPTGAYSGYGFAIPSNMVEKIVSDLKHFGEVQRAYLGINIVEITAEIADQLKLSSLDGVFIYRAIKGGSAYKAGIQDGDVLLSINGKKVNSLSDIHEQLTQFSPGDYVTCEVVRNGKRISFTISLEN